MYCDKASPAPPTATDTLAVVAVADVLQIDNDDTTADVAPGTVYAAVNDAADGLVWSNTLYVTAIIRLLST